VLFDQENIDRMIEIGPNNTLAAMAKKTLASQYSVTEAIRPRKREILCHATDAAKIFEETAVAEVVVPGKDDKPTTAQKSVAPPPPPPQAEAPAAAAAAPPPPPPQQAGAPAASMREIADVPISAGDLVTAIVSSKLKKAHDEIDGTHSIKTLTGGKFTTMSEATRFNIIVYHTNNQNDCQAGPRSKMNSLAISAPNSPHCQIAAKTCHCPNSAPHCSRRRRAA
jgi:fatty acid synthase subunit alpha